MSHWLLVAIAEKLTRALREADRVQFYREMARDLPAYDVELIREVAAALEIAVLDLEVDRLSDDAERRALGRGAAANAFRLLRVLPVPDAPLEAGAHLLRASSLAVLGDRGADAARWLRAMETERAWPTLPLNSQNWG